jgi:hypothetical protein
LNALAESVHTRHAGVPDATLQMAKTLPVHGQWTAHPVRPGMIVLRAVAVAAIAGVALFGWDSMPARAQMPNVPNCTRPGWFPTDFGLKDHSIFWFDGYYYMVSIYLPHNNPGL